MPHDQLMRLQIGLRVHGVQFNAQDVLVTGRNEEGVPIGVAIERTPTLYLPHHTHSRQLSSNAVIEAWRFAEALSWLETSQQHERLKRAWGALLRGLRETNAWEALYQFVRALEGAMAADARRFGAEAFARHFEPILPNSESKLKALYEIRSQIVHLNDISRLVEIWPSENFTVDTAVSEAQELLTG